MHRRPAAAARGEALLALARGAIAEALGVDPPADGPPDADPAAAEPGLNEVGAAFVTLTLDGQLRGCIGTVEPYRALAADVRANAVAAALGDPRFPPLAPDDLEHVHLAVSVLSPLEPVPCGTEAEAAAMLRPGVDGVVLEVGGRRATFLPQVWDQLPEPVAFLRALRRKASLPETPWDGGTRVYRYTVARHEEAP
jgi:AmmeMemoRadiSam system protein A